MTTGADTLLYFACHGSLRPNLGIISHLRLADDVLLAHDVVHRRPRLPAGSLVILNCCDTAVSDYRDQDESVSLTSAFLARGASLIDYVNVVKGRWPYQADLWFSNAMRRLAGKPAKMRPPKQMTAPA